MLRTVVRRQVLQNLEVPLVSRQHATLLLGAALDGARWTLARDLVRFLRAIDPADTETAPPRSPTGPSTDEDTVNQVFMEVILSRHARKLLAAGQLRKLGSFAAHLDFPLEPFLEKERLRAARVDDFVVALKAVHTDFEWPLPQSVAASPTGSVASMGNEEAPPAQRNGPEAPGGGGTNAAVTRGSPADSESTSEESWWAEEEEVSAPVGVAEWRGPPQAEAQARHLLQALGKARCCDWALPLALMLGDSLVAPLVAPPGALDKLLLWASAECPGYLSLLRQVQGGRVLEEAPPGATSNGYPQRSPVHPRRVAVTSAPENPEDEGCRVA
ncbi:hypothetical protein IscW_ISCW015635 [Ixodes scapularis]|uniref:Protein RIC1 homolog n=1 Tax=Ixodes scapularis TaxID=6945 RepID=B7P4F9_IXOSC|nr:hypothetical protein IscW_ISCW015635 [Ixodes scapularis]|eukprot:XP_002406013.1 hypothetical protein IscW_ISCW015635 [Ixodes scapularis]